jgi:translation initiation factor IF-3
MRHIRSLVTTSQALRRTFLPYLDVQGIRTDEYQITHKQTRCYQYQPQPQSLPFRLIRQAGPSRYASRAEEDVIKDEHIRARQVQVVNESGALSSPMTLGDALKSFDRNEHFLLQVAPETWEQPAVCKILSKSQHREQLRAKAVAAKISKAANAPPKQIELNWAIDPNDLSRKLKQMESFLEKGRKVEFLLTRKPRKRLATLDEARNLLRSIKQRIQEIGAAEVRPTEGHILRQVTMIVEMKKRKDT